MGSIFLGIVEACVAKGRDPCDLLSSSLPSKRACVESDVDIIFATDVKDVNARETQGASVGERAKESSQLNPCQQVSTSETVVSEHKVNTFTITSDAVTRTPPSA